MNEKIVDQREIILPPLPQGSESSLRVVEIVYDDGSVKRLWAKDDGVQVLGLTTDNRVIAVTEKGYTHLVGGYIEPDEVPEKAARRELREETGYEGNTLKLLAALYQDSGGSRRAIWLYLAGGCRKVKEAEEGVTVTLMSPRSFWWCIMCHVGENEGTKRRGLMSLAAATLAFHKLGWLTVTPTEKEAH